ncbi:MAG: hypothetical protein KF741_01210 [Ferruginibacter sp.]|nr:hypothetical protein [Bacteroidota bacterium]MBX2917834.1 hypothetical protein [Ferruginibacter sp.]MCB0708680.1 hypothetical protein [Chitinophagaceae bacterium]MCC7380073.1 hypothetical protein [Chitinophagaceae bacterium]
MTTQNENLSPNDSMQLINSMINQAKNNFSENGFLYLVWGWLIFTCSICHFIFLKLDLFKQPEIVWASCWLAVIFQIIYLSRQKKKEKVKTYSENIVNYIWISFGICMFIVVIIMSKTNNWPMMNSIILMLYGTPTFLSGIGMQFKPLVIGGIICWCLAILSVFIPPVYVLLLLAASVLAAWIVPGYLLSSKYKLQNKQ